jgi:hypothetical protein
MITKDERRALLGLTAPIALALLLVLPFIQERVPLALAAISLALATTIMGMAIAAPIQTNRRDYR